MARKGRFVKKTVPVTTNNITDGICNQILADGGSAARINTTGIYREGIGWTYSKSRKGVLDVIACIKGRFVAIDTKNLLTRDRLRPDQIEYIEEVEAAGGITFLAESIEHFNNWYFEFIKTL